MSLLKPTHTDIQNLQEQLSEALGQQFQVETETVVEGILPVIKERFDIVIIYDGQPLAAIEYKSIAREIHLHTHPDWLLEKFIKVGIHYSILYFGKEDEFYVKIRDKHGVVKYTFDGLVAALLTNKSFGKPPKVVDVKR